MAYMGIQLAELEFTLQQKVIQDIMNIKPS